MEPKHFDVRDISRRGALLFGDDCPGTDEALAAIEDAGLSCRIIDRVESAHLALQGAFADVLVIEAATTSEEVIADLLARIIPYARETGTPVIAAASLDRVDLLWSHLAPTGAQILCQPTPQDRRSAIDAALAQSACGTLQDSSAALARNIDLLREDIERVARTFRGLVDASREDHTFAEASAAGEATTPEEVRQIIRTRRLRDRFFDSRLFADPAWDILLDLYAAHLERREVSVSSLCIAAATPPTTALRWIASMTDNNILERRPDVHDKRRHMIALSDTALLAIERYFIALRSKR
jgi:DNA-binding MarR family transcriptional regulator